MTLAGRCVVGRAQRCEAMGGQRRPGPDAVDAALTRLGTSRRELEVWDDQLRAWLAADPAAATACSCRPCASGVCDVTHFHGFQLL